MKMSHESRRAMTARLSATAKSFSRISGAAFGRSLSHAMSGHIKGNNETWQRAGSPNFRALAFGTYE